jgi:hypothetical protein
MVIEHDGKTLSNVIMFMEAKMDYPIARNTYDKTIKYLIEVTVDLNRKTRKNLITKKIINIF